MPATALQHFNEDVARAQAVVAHAKNLPQSCGPERLLRADVLRSAWMFAVGALDAYFSDAYTDIIAATMISKTRHDNINLPSFFYEIKVPVRAVLETYPTNTNWRWRMAARRMMDRENVLKLRTVQSLFNKFFRDDRRLFEGVLDSWMAHEDAQKRMFAITRLDFNNLSVADRRNARRLAKRQMEERFRIIVQRRHDCIHNCDRPRVKPQPLVMEGTVRKVIEDIEFLVHRCDDHIQSEFREFLLRCGCPTTALAQVGY